MGLKERLTGNWRNGAIGALSAFFLGLVFLVLPPIGGGLSRLSYDLAYLFAPRENIDEVRIIYMDDKSYAVLMQDPLQKDPDGSWHRALHTQLLRRLTNQHPKAVVFDIVFDKPFERVLSFQAIDTNVARLLINFGIPTNQLTGRNVDVCFSKAIANATNVVLAGSYSVEDKFGTLIPSELNPTGVLGNEVRWGVTEFPDEPDKRIRRHYDNPACTNLSWKVAELVAPEKLRGQDRLSKRWLRYYGPAKTIPCCSYYQVFTNGALPSNYFTGKVVFIGRERVITSQGSVTKDDFPTPYTRLGEKGNTPGVELQATAYLNLVNRDWITELSPPWQMLLLVLLAVIFGYGLTLLRPWIAAAASVGIFLGIAGLALVLFWHKQLWFPWLIIAAIEIPTALGWAVLSNTKKLYQEKLKVEEAYSKLVESVRASGEGQTNGSSLPGDPPRGIGPMRAATRSTNPNAETLRGPEIPNYELVRRVGGGAYGEVWLCKDILGSYHAVKIIFRSKFSSNAPFEREFRGLQRFTPISRSHPGLVQVLHVGKNDNEGYFYYMMEVGDDQKSGQNIDPQTYSAKNLANELEKRGRFPFKECLQLSLDITAALDFLHQQNLVHRDIKPSNIIFVRGVPKIADIGLVTEATDDRSLVGTPGFMAPDQKVTPAADVYSLGKVIYEAAMGRSQSHFPDFPTNLIEWPDYKGVLELNKIILRACETSLSIRYKDAGEMHKDLLKLQSVSKS